MIENIWNRIISWFRDRSERRRLIRSFNDAARDAFVAGETPAMLVASISKGDSAYRHYFSKWLASGFRLKVFSGRSLTREEMIFIGTSILNDEQLVRRLYVLGWDTLEIYGENSTSGFKWKLSDFISQIHVIGSQNS